MGQVKFRIEGGLNSEGNLLPDDNNNTYYLGSSSLKWKGLYLGSDGILFNDGSQLTSLSDLKNQIINGVEPIVGQFLLADSNSDGLPTISLDINNLNTYLLGYGFVTQEDTQILQNKTIVGKTYLQQFPYSNTSGGYIYLEDSSTPTLELNSNGDLFLTAGNYTWLNTNTMFISASGNIVINTPYIQLNGKFYYGAQSSDNEIVTKKNLSDAVYHVVKTSDTGTVTSTMIADSTIVDGDISSTAAIQDSKLAQITSNNKVANSATTATDSNTASTIVARDSSGNFTANLITVNTTPTENGHAASKAYVDTVASGMNWHQAVKAATTTNLSAVYSNGSSGVGATLTADTNRIFTTLDGVTPWSLGDRVLVKDQTSQIQNGIYTLTTLGTSSAPWVLTRASDANNSVAGQVQAGDAIYVKSGTLNGNQAFVEITDGTGTNQSIVIGTDSIVFSQFTGASNLTAGNGLTRTGNSIDVVSSTLTVSADSIDLPTVSRSNTTGSSTNSLISSITTDTYGRVTAVATSPINVATSLQQGVATFNTASFTVTSGDVTIKSGGVSNSQLANSTTTIGTTAIALGASSTTLTGVTENNLTLTGTLTAGESTGTSGQVLQSTGTGVQWGTAGASVTSTTVNTNTSFTVDTVALSGFTTIEYTLSLKQGSVVRSSKVFVQNNGASVDYIEYAVMNTGGFMAGVTVTAAASSTNSILQVTVTNAAISNVTTKFTKVVI